MKSMLLWEERMMSYTNLVIVQLTKYMRYASGLEEEKYSPDLPSSFDCACFIFIVAVKLKINLILIFYYAMVSV